ncbi:hypothetical protein Dimus_018904 [Dionaea muscipula]
MEVAQMEAILHEHKNQMPAKEMIEGLADKFSKSAERAGKITVQGKQVWNWFQNKRYALRAKMVKSPGKLTVIPMPREDVASFRITPQGPPPVPAPSGGKSAPENSQMEFEAKSARDGAWYDVQGFLSHRYLETGDPEVLVRFVGFGPEEDEWINVRRNVRQRSLPCESTECVVVLPGDLILCFQEGKEQALYFDAQVLDAQRRRHDVRGCRCRFLVRYVHDQTEEIVPLRKLCRRPETDYRMHVLHAANESASVDPQKAVSDPASVTSVRMPNSQEPTLAYQRATVIHPRVCIAAAPSQVNTVAISGTIAPAQANTTTRPPTTVAVAPSQPNSVSMAPPRADVTAIPRTMAPPQANVTATTPVTVAPAMANMTLTSGIVAPAAQANVLALTAGTISPAQANANANAAHWPATAATTAPEQKNAAVPAVDGAVATPIEQRKRDVSPPPGFTRVPMVVNPTAAPTATQSDLMEE